MYSLIQSSFAQTKQIPSRAITLHKEIKRMLYVFHLTSSTYNSCSTFYKLWFYPPAVFDDESFHQGEAVATEYGSIKLGTHFKIFLSAKSKEITIQ